MLTGYENVVWWSGIRHYWGKELSRTNNTSELLDAYVISFAVRVPIDTEAVALDGKVVPIIQGMIWKHLTIHRDCKLSSRIIRFRSSSSDENDLLLFENVPLIYFGNRIPVVKPLSSLVGELQSALASSRR